MSKRTAIPTFGDVRWTPRARPLLAVLVFGLALAVTACGSGTPIGGTASPHATPTPTPIPSPATTLRIIPSPNPPSPQTTGLVAVSALTPADAWAVGGTYTDCFRWQPLIERLDGVTWHIVPSPG